MTTRTTHARTSPFTMARSRGAVTGPLLMLLGAWGALIPFFGHSFNFGFTPDTTWHWTAARGWLEVLPGAAAFVGGALLTTSRNRASGMLGGWVAAAAGAWFVIGTVINPFWNAGNIGVPVGDAHRVAWEQLGMFSGLGVVILLFAALAIGRISVVGVRDVAAAQARQEARTVDVTDRADTAVTTPAAPAGSTVQGATVEGPMTAGRSS